MSNTVDAQNAVTLSCRIMAPRKHSSIRKVRFPSRTKRGMNHTVREKQVRYLLPTSTNGIILESGVGNNITFFSKNFIFLARIFYFQTSPKLKNSQIFRRGYLESGRRLAGNKYCCCFVMF